MHGQVTLLWDTGLRIFASELPMNLVTLEILSLIPYTILPVPAGLKPVLQSSLCSFVMGSLVSLHAYACSSKGLSMAPYIPGRDDDNTRMSLSSQHFVFVYMA